jgi:hypothetical protein
VDGVAQKAISSLSGVRMSSRKSLILLLMVSSLLRANVASREEEQSEERKVLEMSGLAQVWVSSFMIFVILDTSFNFLKP